MRGNRMMGFAVLCGLVIVCVSVGVAYVLFGILESSASADLRQWKLGGAFAGFAFTASLLASTVLQVYREMRRDKEEDYVKQIQELQSKLIRGAPQPPGFTIDVDERHKLVFARPVGWRHRSGVLYQYIAVPTHGDHFAANFNVVFETPHDLEAAYGLSASLLEQRRPFSPDELESLYRLVVTGMLEHMPRAMPGYAREGFSEEYVLVDGLKSLRYTHAYSMTHDSGVTRLTQVGVAIFQSALPGMFTFTFTDDSDDFLVSSEQFNHVISSIRFL